MSEESHIPKAKVSKDPWNHWWDQVLRDRIQAGLSACWEPSG